MYVYDDLVSHPDLHEAGINLKFLSILKNVSIEYIKTKYFSITVT